MNVKPEFTLDSLAHSLARILERVMDEETLRAWYEEEGIDRDVLMELADSLAENRELFNQTSFILGFVLAWEINSKSRRAGK